MYLTRELENHMTPGNTILNSLQTLLAADTGTLAAALALHVHLAKASFSPGPGLTPASFTEADFGGYAILNAGTGTQQTFTDPVNGNRIVQMLEPAGGWHWQATSGVMLPQTIFGFYLTNNGNTVLYGSQLLPTPILLVASGDGVDVAQVRFALLPTSPI